MTPYNVLLNAALPVLLLLVLSISSSEAGSTQNGEEARWLVQTSKWATLSWLEEGEIAAFVTSIAESDGRIFFYLQKPDKADATITLSEAQVNPAQFFGAKCGLDGDLDPEDPRCAKLTISGILAPCEDDSKQLALDTLFATHPQMADWPDDHGFVACELKIHDKNGLWMIANFGGGGYMDAADYHDSEPVHHPVKGFGGNRKRARALASDITRRRYLGEASCYNPENHECECTAEKCGNDLCAANGGIWSDMCPDMCECDANSSPPSDTAETSKSSGSGGHSDGTGGGHGDGSGGGHGQGNGKGGGHGHGDGSGGGHDGDHGSDGGSDGSPPKMLPRPDFKNDAAGHARWIVAKSLWTTISTVSSSSEGQTFGNIRSVVDGPCFLSSSGLPYFYVPAPDPTAMDIKESNNISLSFTEAALAERVSEGGSACGGQDAEDPTCGKLSLIGHAIPLEDDDEIELAKRSFAAQHPRASWLASGGGHTGGKYYNLHLHEIKFLRNYGGFSTVSPAEYLDWKPDLSNLPGETMCEMGESGHHGSYGEVRSHSTTTPKYAIVLLIFASFVGSFLGGLFSEKVNAYWRSRRNLYAVANAEENSFQLEVTKAEAC